MLVDLRKIRILLYSLALVSFALPAQPSKKFEEFLFRKAGAPDSSSDVVLRANPDSQIVVFVVLYSFLNRNDAYNRQSYKRHEWDCKHFAAQLFNDAHSAGIFAQYSVFGIRGQESGHAVVAFPTLDQGTVYVDVTPTSDENGKSQFAKRFVWVQNGDPYYSMTIEKHGIDFKNNKGFFEKARDSFVSYQDALKNHNDEVRQFNASIEKINLERTKLDEEIRKFNKSRRRQTELTDSLDTRREAYMALKQKLDLEHARLNGERGKLKKFSDDTQGVLIGDWVIESPRIVFPEEKIQKKPR